MHSPPAPSSVPPFPFFGYRDHHVQFYSDDDSLIDTVENLLRGALEKGDGAVFVATRNHLNALAGRFQARDHGLSLATEQGRYLPLDVTELLSAAMPGGKLDEACICDLLESTIQRATAALEGENQVTVFGEIAAQLWSEGKCEEVLRWERLWNHLSQQTAISAHCVYPIQGFSRPDDDEYLQLICAEHCSFICPESFRPVGDEPDPDRLLAEERPLVESNTEPSYPQWQTQYRAAVLEWEPIPLFKKVEVAQAVVLTRLHELRDQPGHSSERNQLTRAWRVLQTIKRGKLGFVE